MGGLYVPDVILPGDGDFELWIAIKKDGSFTYNVSGKWRDGKQKVVSVPPHGDLMDRDAARGSIKPWSPEDERNGCILDTAKKLMHTMLDRAPTIIPAEERMDGNDN